MRLQKYLINDSKNEDIEWYSKFYKDCKPYITDWVKCRAPNFLYRNVNNSYKSFGIKRSYVDKGRKPADTPLELHNFFNDYFYDKFRWKVRNGVAAIGIPFKSGQYGGEPHLFFPIGNYKFVWSPKIGDLFTHFDSMRMLDPPDEEDCCFDDSDWEEQLEVMRDNYYDSRQHAMDDLKYTDKNLKRAIESHNEIYFNCKKYYVINMRYGNILEKLIRDGVT
jgi:hypothetical protein